MSAREELLTAARRLREVSAAATPGPWEDCSDPDGGAWPRYVIGSPAPGSDRGEEVLRVHESIADHQVVTRDDTAWIALAHPGLAGPLAALLEGIAGRHIPIEESGGQWCAEDSRRLPCPDVTAALAVARAINGEVPR